MIKPINNLEDLADSFVPEQIIINSPKFYEIIKAFLRNVQEVQSSINTNFIDNIDYDKIKNPEFRKTLLDIYIKTMKFDGVDNLDSLSEMVKVGRNLSTIKGTVLLYEIMYRLLLYIIPGLGDQYNTLLEELNDPDTDPSRIAEIEEELVLIENAQAEGGYTNVEEFEDVNGDIIPFKYKVELDLDEFLYYKYIHPFAHISGWEEEYSQVIARILSDSMGFHDKVTIHDYFDFPLAQYNGEVQYPESEYPDNVYEPVDLGDENQISVVSSKIFNTSNLSIVGGRILYSWDSFKSTEEFITEGENVVIKSPAWNEILLTAGGYSGNTTDIAKANGTLSYGSLKYSHKIIHQENKYFKTITG